MTSDEALAAIEVECEAFLKLHPDWYRDGRWIHHPNGIWGVRIVPIDDLNGNYYLSYRGWFRGSVNVSAKTTAESKCGLEVALESIKTHVRHEIRSLQLQLDHVSKPHKEITEEMEHD